MCDMAFSVFQSLATLLITSQILNQIMEAFLPYWLQRRRNKKAHKRLVKVMGDRELPLPEQAQLESDMSTYLVRRAPAATDWISISHLTRIDVTTL